MRLMRRQKNYVTLQYFASIYIHIGDDDSLSEDSIKCSQISNDPSNKEEAGKFIPFLNLYCLLVTFPKTIHVCYIYHIYIYI